MKILKIYLRTVCVNGEDVLAVLFMSPEYAAVIVCEPFVSEEVEYVV